MTNRYITSLCSCWLILCLSLAAMGNDAWASDRVLLVFHADWCGPCRTVMPSVNALARDGYEVCRVNVDRQPATTAQYGVERVPCFILLDDGREVERIVGPASMEQLKLMYRGHNPKSPNLQISKSSNPLPAWRYERPEGYRAAVVRIICRTDGRTRAIGSGTLVRWGAHIVVLTARHVVKDARSILVELHTKRTCRAKVIAVDAVWDCAVLELEDRLHGVEPAEMEMGQAAMQATGNRLESCGYGPDGRLACNSGLFLGYKRSTATPGGPDDWFAISGRARGGDSGGGVFNQRGRLVGVLWGTDGHEVVCVQAGRLHKLLDAAVPEGAAQMKSILHRAPTPAKRRGEGREERGEKVEQLAIGTSSSLLPWRKEVEEHQRAAADALQRIEARLNELGGGLEAGGVGRGTGAANAPSVHEEDLTLRERLRNRIHDRVENVKERVDGLLDSPFARHAFFIACAGVVIWIAISQHRRAGTPTLLERVSEGVKDRAKAAAVANPALAPLAAAATLNDRIVDGLGQRLRDLDAKLDAKVDSVQQQVNQTALNTPAPNQIGK